MTGPAGQPGGFVSARRSLDRVGVGCESCHGPSRGHVAKPEVHTPNFGGARQACTGCHEHSCARTDEEHGEVAGYQCKDRKCYECHRFAP